MQHDYIILDRSGSMDDVVGLWTESLAAANSYVKGLAEKKVDTGVTLACFDWDKGVPSFDIVRDRIIPSTWDPVTRNEVAPRGGTPLNDSIVKTIQLADAGNYDKVAIIIITDGLENSSVEYADPGGRACVNKMLDERRAKGWQILFVGANFDNAAQGRSYGAASGQTISAKMDMLVTSTHMMANKRAAWSAGATRDMSYTTEEKEQLAKKPEKKGKGK